MPRLISICLLLFLWFPICLDASVSDSTATTTRDSIYHYDIELNGAFARGAHTPFWLVNNRFGLSSIKKVNGHMRAGFFREDNHSKPFGYSFGADLAVAGGYTSTFIIQQLYGGIRYKCLDLTVGSRETRSQMVNPELSSGDLLFSDNARPIPQARLAIEQYTIVPWTRRWLAVRGYISMGAFTDERFQKSFTQGLHKRTKHVLFHSKGGFLRIGNRDRFPLVVEGGLEMAAQWGGTIIYPDGHTLKMPHSFKDALKIIFPTGSDSSNPELAGEVSNVLGNHTGQWCAALDWHDKAQTWGARAYFEHYFEDHSMMFFDFKWRDMLLGFEIDLPANPIVSSIVYEYLYTKDQAGAVYWDHTPDIPEQVSGRDDYYNHYLYTGWEHWGMGIGNPLVISPIYNTDNTLSFKDNRIMAHHIGWKGSPLPGVDYRVLISYSRSWGTYDQPNSYVKRNLNGLLEVTWHPRRLSGWAGCIGIGADGGSLLGKSAGVMLTISKSGWL